MSEKQTIWTDYKSRIKKEIHSVSGILVYIDKCYERCRPEHISFWASAKVKFDEHLAALQQDLSLKLKRFVKGFDYQDIGQVLVFYDDVVNQVNMFLRTPAGVKRFKLRATDPLDLFDALEVEGSYAIAIKRLEDLRLDPEAHNSGNWLNGT